MKYLNAKVCKKILYLHRKCKKHTITDSELLQYNSMLNYNNLTDEEIVEIVKKRGYGKKAHMRVACCNYVNSKKEFAAFVLLIIVLFVLWIGRVNDDKDEDDKNENS